MHGVPNFQSWGLKIGELEFCSASTYSDAPDEGPVSFLGSHGFVELALRNGSAAVKTAMKSGDSITLQFSKTADTDR